jgi:Flp pilus assembly protein TadD
MPVAGLLVITLSLTTLLRARVWRSPVALWSEAVAAAPTAWAPQYALGDALRGTGDCVAAAEAYAAAAALARHEPRPRVNRALCLVTLGRLDEAEAELLDALKLVPRDARVRNDLGMLALTRGQTEQARAHFEQALALDPHHDVARANLARIVAK